MRKILLAFIISGIGFASCNKEAVPLTKQEIKQKIDSITTIRIKELDNQSQIDLDHRMKIEVKVKVDSMVTAMRLLQSKQDSALQAKSVKKIPDAAPKLNIPTK